MMMMGRKMMTLRRQGGWGGKTMQVVGATRESDEQMI